MEDNVILRIGAKILIPFILLFALYVQFHGDYGPGPVPAVRGFSFGRWAGRSGA